MRYLGAFLTGFLLVGAVYNPAWVFMAGIIGIAGCVVLLPLTLTLWFIQQIIKELKT